MSLAVANQYAQALADVVLEADSGADPGEVAKQLKAFEVLLLDSTELRNIMLSPAVSPVEKRAVIGRLAPYLEMSPVVRNFLSVVINRRRTDLLREIRQAFEDLLDARLGLVRAKVNSAAPLNETQRLRLAEALAELTGKKIRCEYKIDESLLGGAVVRIGSTVYDGSVQGKLDDLRRRLVE